MATILPPVNSIDLHQLAEILSLTSVLKQLVGECSAGQKRRLSVSRLWLCQRSIWLLDEPCMNLDPHAEQLLYTQIQSVLKKGSLVVMSTHRPDNLLEDAVILAPNAWRGS
jgi:ABC-type transport system involved in cytochrome c biogenesis ATPase subunit